MWKSFREILDEIRELNPAKIRARKYFHNNYPRNN